MLKIPYAHCSNCKFIGDLHKGFSPKCLTRGETCCQNFQIKTKFKIPYLPLRLLRVLFIKIINMYFPWVYRKVYMAGPYSANKVLDVFYNMRDGIDKSSEAFHLKTAPFCPWLDYQFILSGPKLLLNVSDFYNYSIAYLLISEALILVTSDYLHSVGTMKEIVIAQLLGVKIYDDLGSYAHEKRLG